MISYACIEAGRARKRGKTWPGSGTHHGLDGLVVLRDTLDVSGTLPIGQAHGIQGAAAQNQA